MGGETPPLPCLPLVRCVVEIYPTPVRAGRPRPYHVCPLFDVLFLPPIVSVSVIRCVVMGMKYNPRIHHRRSIRLPGYDYSQEGAYFVTTCVQDRECLFGAIQDDQMNLNDCGKIVDQWWHHLPIRFDTVELDAAIIMPNHFHGIIIIHPDPDAISASSLTSYAGRGAVFAPNHTSMTGGSVAGGSMAGGETPPLRGRPGLGQIVAYFKYQTTKMINQWRNAPGQKVWQRNYYEHIIRNDSSFEQLRHYICHNPQQWITDQLHPQVASKW